MLERPLIDDEVNAAALLDDPATALDAIARCVELKADVVARDEEDRTGIRAVLNFGHTVGHALEKVAGYGALRHGEAVIASKLPVSLATKLPLEVSSGDRIDLLDNHLAGDALDTGNAVGNKLLLLVPTKVE